MVDWRNLDLYRPDWCPVCLEFNLACLHTVLSAICRLRHIWCRSDCLTFWQQVCCYCHTCTGVLFVTAVPGYCIWGVVCYCSTGLLCVGCCLLLQYWVTVYRVLLVTAVPCYCVWGVACYCSTGLLCVGCCLLLQYRVTVCRVLLVTAVPVYSMWGVGFYCSTGLLYVRCCLLLLVAKPSLILTTISPKLYQIAGSLTLPEIKWNWMKSVEE